ncbi:MAG: hypothetical protein GY842_01445 [bacterium]|nr:hypothetical protein [bacterium]
MFNLNRAASQGPLMMFGRALGKGLAVLALCWQCGCWYGPISPTVEQVAPDDQAPEEMVTPDTEPPAALVRPMLGYYFNDFEAAVNEEWSTDQRAAAPEDLRVYLGEFANDTVTLRLDDLPEHEAVSVVTDIYVIGSWDGNSHERGPDVWSLTTGEGQTLIETTFSYTASPRQAYPNSYPFGSNPGRTGSIENNSLGHSYYDSDGVLQQWNSVYQVHSTFEHEADTLTLEFAAQGLEQQTETWGLDNVSVMLAVPNDKWETALIIEAEDFESRAIGGPVPGGWNIWQSGRLTDWVRCDPRCRTLRVTSMVRGESAYGHWPIMGLTVNQRFEARTTVAQREWTPYLFELDLTEDVQQIGFAFTNDEPPVPGQDRNLIVDRIEFAVPVDTPVDAWPVREPAPEFMAEPAVPQTDAEIMELARANIEQHRKGDMVIRMLDPSGAPLAGADVRFDMFRHHFRWGTAVRFDLENPDRPVERRYRDRLAEMFNYGTTENVLRWGHFEAERGEPKYDELDAYIDICAQLGIELKAHNLVWGHFQDIPGWFTEEDIANSRELLEARTRETLSHFAGRLRSYDIVNEPIHALQWEFWAGSAYVEDTLNWAHEADPDATLMINEFEIIAVPYMADNFFVRMRELLDRGAPLGGVGVQLHANLGEWYMPLDIWRGFERMSQLGVEVHLTEVSLGAENTIILGGPHDGEPWSDDRQAEYYSDVMTLAFGHPHVESMTYWGFTDRRHFQPGSGLWDLELRPKAAGVAYQRLLEETWSTDQQVTTDSDGIATLRAFYGWYRISRGNGVAVVEFLPEDAAVDSMLEVEVHPFGDDNLDGKIDQTDLAAFQGCFTDADVRTVLPPCAHFDFDGDRDVDCDDWSRFDSTWSAEDSPAFLPCTMPIPTAEASGCRYITVTPPPGTEPIALYITSSDWLCVAKYIDADGMLADEPVFLTPSEFGQLHLASPLIVPDAVYHIQAFDGAHLSRRATVKTWRWGDANNDGVANDDDIVLVVDAFHGDYTDLPFQRVDMGKCMPNRGVDFDDVTFVISAAAGEPYADSCPDPCNNEGDTWVPGEDE